MEALSKIFIVDEGFLLGFFVGSRNIGVLYIYHLLFANETLTKSKLVRVGNVNNGDGLASIMG